VKRVRREVMGGAANGAARCAFCRPLNFFVSFFFQEKKEKE
jgi:hypothetical protein